MAEWYNYTLPAGSWLYFTGAVQLTAGLSDADSAVLTVTNSILSFADDKGVVRAWGRLLATLHEAIAMPYGFAPQQADCIDRTRLPHGASEPSL